MTSSSRRRVGRIVLGSILLFTGASHLTIGRREFRAQVPKWLPGGVDDVVVASGVAELALGGALVTTKRHPALVGLAAAAFFVAIFPGNISQFVNRRDGFGLNTDLARGLRLLGQPALVAWALWSGGVFERRSQQ